MKCIKLQTVWKAAKLMPVTVLLAGVPALVLFWRHERLWPVDQLAAERAGALFQAFYKVMLWGGAAVILVEAGMMIAGMVLLMRNFCRPKRERTPSGLYWRMMLGAPLIAVGTAVVLFFGTVFTYGMYV